MKYFGFVFTALLIGCTSNNTQLLKVQLDELTNRVRELESTNSGFRTRIEGLETEIEVLKDRLSAIRKKHPHFQADRRDPGAPKNLPEEVVKPQELPKGDDFAASQSGEMDVKYARIDDNGDVVQGGNEPQKTTVSQPPVPRAVSDGNDGPKALYHRAFDAYRHGNKDRAIELFSGFVRKYPNSDLADNALYWIGECYYDRKEYKKAKTYFTRVVVRYPKGNKVADAMLKVGMCNEMMNRIGEAKRLFKAVVLGYPDSSAAQIATDMMNKLK